jgi:hypothetical protein
MAIARDTTAANIKPLNGAQVRRGTLGATTAAGEIVELQSDGKWDPAAATAVIKSGRIALQGGADGDVVDMVCFGPAQCLTGATVGAIVYVSDTAGEPAETAGTKSAVIGYAESATVLFVNFQTVAFV